MPHDLSEKGLAVFAFALYHQLSTGDAVSAVTVHDEAGHKADPSAIEELTRKGLAQLEGSKLQFTQQGQRLLRALGDAIRGAA